MPTFRYKSSSQSAGGAGVIDAPDRAAAVRLLVGRGITPAAVEALDGPVPEPKPSPAKGSAGQNGRAGQAQSPTAPQARPSASPAPTRRGRAMNLGETASFIRELATATQAGLPLVPALRTLAKSGRTPAQSAMLAHLIERVEQGTALAEACRSWGKPFDELVVNLIRAGEVSGRLTDVLHQCADLLEKDLELRRSIMGATLYPAILTVLVGAAVVVVTTFIVPQVLKPLKGQNIVLPLPTRIVEGFAGFMSTYWWLVMGAIAALILAWSRARATPGPRLVIDRTILATPVLGPLVRDALVARFTRTLGTLVKAGLPVLSALRLTAATITNHAMRGAVNVVCDQVAAGKTIAEPLERTGLFPPLLVQIVSLGERSGRLPDLLTQAAGALEGRTETRVKIFTTILPPLLIVMLAVIVGCVVAAIILPLLQMQDAVGRM
ncbi:MAG: type II secretion system F family protein [Phycisphaeraceae bacterium]|nr:type II secretion system F family protein [Phycisphaeraceae bacterium]